MPRTRALLPLLLLVACAPRLDDAGRADLRRELAAMAELDQVAAYIPEGKYADYTPDRWTAFRDSVFGAHTSRAEALFDRYGYLGNDLVGEGGAKDFWLIVQHSDARPDFQRRVLKEMDRAVHRGNADAASFAYLADRVDVNAGQPQRFGTQVTYATATTGRAYPKNGLVDSADVDRRRAGYALPPLRDYLNDMTRMHFEMNAAHYRGIGVEAPVLYD